MARLLREHLQPGAGEPEPDAGAHAEEVLAEPARDRGDPGPRTKCRLARFLDAGAGADDADETHPGEGARGDARPRDQVAGTAQQAPEGLGAAGEGSDPGGPWRGPGG